MPYMQLMTERLTEAMSAVTSSREFHQNSFSHEKISNVSD